MINYKRKYFCLFNAKKIKYDDICHGVILHSSTTMSKVWLEYILLIMTFVTIENLTKTLFP